MSSIALLALLLPVVASAPLTKVVLLGTGTPAPDPERWGPASAVVVNGTAYIVDCGPGVVRRAAGAYAKGIDSLRPSKLRFVFITHLHSDHTIGYPDLILSPWVVGRTDPLEAYGPSGLQWMTDNLLAAYKEDIDVRTEGLERGNETGYHVHVHEIQPGEIYRDANVTVTAFPVHHGSWKEAYGFRFQTADRTVVFSGDTCPCDSEVAPSTGADVLVHEVYDAAYAVPEKRPGGDEWPEYMREFHTSAQELGKLAARCKPTLLVLYHVLRAKGTTDQQLIEQVRSGGFKGRVKVGRDLSVY